MLTYEYELRRSVKFLRKRTVTNESIFVNRYHENKLRSDQFDENHSVSKELIKREFQTLNLKIVVIIITTGVSS